MQKKNQKKGKKEYHKPEINEVNLTSKDPTGAAAAAAAAVFVAAVIGTS